MKFSKKYYEWLKNANGGTAEKIKDIAPSYFYHFLIFKVAGIRDQFESYG